MKIAIMNKKGGVGKTPFAFSIAKDLNLFLQSNDNSCIEQIYPDKAKVVDKVQSIDNCVFDFGGFVAPGVLEIISQCDYVIIPCTPVYNSLLRTAETIIEIQDFNSNIVILATDFVDDRELKSLKKELGEEPFNKFTTFYFKKSKIVNNAIKYGMSFMELYNDSVLSRNSYSNFIAEYVKLLKTIKNPK